MRDVAVSSHPGPHTQSRPAERPPFVGREKELDQLAAAFDSAASGQGGLILLVGEPGIGKTALCQQFATYATRRGGLALVGHCYEQGSFRQPYQPFVEVFSRYMRDRDADALRAVLGSGASDLSRMLPILRERLQVGPRPPADPEEDRWRLLQAATDLLHSAAADQPLLVVLEDLHDSDRGTLDMLLYLARNTGAARLLLVGTYRDVEVDRAHPLSAALAELHRANTVARFHLRGLSTDEVSGLLGQTTQQAVPRPFAELVHRQTDGNPLFVQEILRFVIEEGLVEPRGGALRRVGEHTLAGRIPEGLRDAVGKRLSRLADATNRVLSVASVIGREFQLDVLERVLGAADDGLERALEEASSAAIIEERSVIGTTITYRFSHAFFRQTLYDEIVAPRRIRLHQQVARALEAIHHRRLDEHAAELAEHYAFSSDLTDLAKSVHYAELAARRAADVFAYGEAARQLEGALLVQDLVDPEDHARRADLLLALADAMCPAGETPRVISDIAPEALALAEKLGDWSRASRACGLALDAYVAQLGGSPMGGPDFLSWAEQARRYARPDGVERVRADIALAQTRQRRRHSQEARELFGDALTLARRLDDPESLFRSAFWVMLVSDPPSWAENLRLAEEVASWRRQRASGRSVGVALWQAGCMHLAAGEPTRAEDLWKQVEELADRTHVVTLLLFLPQRHAILATLDGRLEDARKLSHRFVERGDELGSAVRARAFNLQVFHSAALYLGQPEAWLAAHEEYAQLVGPGPDGIPNIAMRATCLARLGRLEQARALIGGVLDEFESSTNDNHETVANLIRLLQAAVALEHSGAARAISERLACVGHLSTGDWSYTCPARHLAEAALLLGDRSSARAYYQQAIDAAGKIGFRPEVALAHLGLAELLLAAGEHPAAVQHLDLALPELRDMGMQPALERAVALVVKRPAATDALTARENDIARLLADGLSNRAIAEKLVISDSTVEVHVKHILSKLGLRSRSQVAAWIHGLPSPEDVP